jgi:AP-4 complex subunit sigma-1
MEERVALESEIIRKCLSRSELQCSFLEYRGYKVIYRRYASLFFIVGTQADVDISQTFSGSIGNGGSSDAYTNAASSGGGVGTSNSNTSKKVDNTSLLLASNKENELGLLEFIHNLVETMDKWAGSICELDIMYQLEEVHFILDEMVMNGYIVETCKGATLKPVDLLEKESRKREAMFK